MRDGAEFTELKNKLPTAADINISTSDKVPRCLNPLTRFSGNEALLGYRFYSKQSKWNVIKNKSGDPKRKPIKENLLNFSTQIPGCIAIKTV